LLVLLLNSNCD